jgi:pimeloyl-ACP methyl ester carboxylesterase
MPTTLLALHGYTMNGAGFRAALSELVPRLEPHVDLVFPDAPHLCSDESLKRFYRGHEAFRPSPPHRTWWYASDDGREYDGVESSKELLRDLLGRHAPAALLGFSQGALAAAAACGWSARGELPPPAFAVFVAGRMPRASALLPLFERELSVPSLHVWGTSDRFATGAPELLARFAAASREFTTWDGPHMVPTRGAAADSIVRFAARFAAS